MSRQTTTVLAAATAFLMMTGPGAQAAIYTGGSGDAYSMSAMASDAGLGGALVTLASAANQSLTRGYASVAISTITITDYTTPAIKSGTSIVVRIPAGLAMTWDETDTTATFGGTAAGKVGVVSYAASNRHLVIAVTSDFAANDTLTVSALSFKNYLGAGSDRLELDFNNDGLDDADDGKTVTILSGFHHGGLEDSYALCAMNDDQKLRANEGAVFMFARNGR